jgi:gamma-glutamyltranspeptidase/glutathione hydrolase
MPRRTRRNLFSAISPVIVNFALGGRAGRRARGGVAPGGSTIITTVARLVIDMIDYRMEPLEALTIPGYHHQWSPDLLYCEETAFTWS